MIVNLLPEDVVGDDTRESDLADPPEKFPEEVAHVANSTPERQREFLTVRACARRALAALGVPPVALLPGHRGVPGWPPGVVGSMTHCRGYRAAAVAPSAKVRAVGIDAEPNEPLPAGILESIALPEEQRRLRAAGTLGGVRWDRLLFSAKESVYKTWFPLTRIEMDFPEADIAFRPEGAASTDGTFTARLLRTAPGMPTAFHGRWLLRDGVVATAVVLRP